MSLKRKYGKQPEKNMGSQGTLKFPVFLKKDLVNFSPYKRSLEMAMLFNVERLHWKPWALQYHNWLKNLDRNGALEFASSLSEMAVRFIEDFLGPCYPSSSVPAAKPEKTSGVQVDLLDQEKIRRAVGTVASVLQFVSVQYEEDNNQLEPSVGKFHLFLETICQKNLLPYFSTCVVHGLDLFSVDVRNSQSLNLFCRCVTRCSEARPVPFSLAEVDTQRAVSKVMCFVTLFLRSTIESCSSSAGVHPKSAPALREWGLFCSTVYHSFVMLAWDRKGMKSELFYADLRKTCLWRWVDGFLASQTASRTGVLICQVTKFLKTLKASGEVPHDVWTCVAAVFFDPLMWQQYFFCEEVCLVFYLGLVECWDWVRPVLEAHFLLPKKNPEQQAIILAQLSPLRDQIKGLVENFFEVCPSSFGIRAELSELKNSIPIPKNLITEFVTKGSDGFGIWQVRNLMGPSLSRRNTLTNVVYIARGVLNVQSSAPAFAPRVLTYPIRNPCRSFSERTQAALVGLQALLSFKQHNPWFLQKSSHVFSSELQRTSFELFEFLVGAANISRRQENPVLSREQQQEVFRISEEGLLPIYFMKRVFIRRVPFQTRILIDRLRSGLPLRFLPIYRDCLPAEELLFTVTDIVENIFSFIDIREMNFIDLLIWSFLPTVPYPPNLRFGG